MMTEEDLNLIATKIEAKVRELSLSDDFPRMLANLLARNEHLREQVTHVQTRNSALEVLNRKLIERHDAECVKYINEGIDLLTVIGVDEVPADAMRRLNKERGEALAEAQWYKQDRDNKGQLVKELLSQRDDAERKSAEVLRRLEALEKSARDRIDALERALKPLADIADRYDDDGLDECRPEWKHPNDADVQLYSGRGGRELLYLRDALKARRVLRGDK